MTKFSSLMGSGSGLVLIMAVWGVPASAQQRWADRQFEEIRRESARALNPRLINGVKQLDAPVVVQPGVSASQEEKKLYIELKSVQSSDPAASLMIMQRYRIRGLLKSMKENLRTDPAQVETLRDLTVRFRMAAEKELISLPLPSDKEAVKNKAEAQSKLAPVGSSLKDLGAAFGLGTLPAFANKLQNKATAEEEAQLKLVQEKASDALGKSSNLVGAGAVVIGSEWALREESKRRKHELDLIYALERDVNAYAVDAKGFGAVLEETARRQSNPYSDAPGIDDLDSLHTGKK